MRPEPYDERRDREAEQQAEAGERWPMSEDVLTVQCLYCLKPMDVAKAYSCVCAKEGNYAHDQAAYCSMDCLANDHDKDPS